MSGQSFSKAFLISTLVGAGALVATPSLAEVRHVGDWRVDPEVTLDLDRTPRDEAVKRLAAAAGWSLVSTVPPGEPVDIHVRHQRAGKILALLLTDGDYVVTRGDGLLAVSRLTPGQAWPAAAHGSGALPPLPPLPPLSPLPPIPPLSGIAAPAEPAAPADPADPAEPAVPDEPAEPAEPAAPAEPAQPAAPGRAHHGSHENGSDREVFGNNLRIEKNEIVNDVAVVGGNLEVLGTVRGDVVVTGGNVLLRRGAHVMGDVTAMGGNITLEDSTRIDGDVGTVGGVLKRARTAEIHGDVKVDDRDHGKQKASEEEPKASVLRHAFTSAGDAVTAAALLFVFGAVLLSLATARMENLKVEIASRPMRSFAMGIVAVLGWIGLSIALCVTVVGIPLAMVTIVGGVVALFAGLAATLETVGGALLGHKTKNPYVHLAFGCGLFIVLGAIPFVGDFVKVAVVLVGLGSVASTRGAGLFPAKNRSVGSPYRNGVPAM